LRRRQNRHAPRSTAISTRTPSTMPAMAPLEMPELVAALEVAADDEAVPDADAEGDADADAEAEADFEGEAEGEGEADAAPREIFFEA
jgi:hypothetical protein